MTAPFLPFTIDLPSWSLVEQNLGPDEWSYDSSGNICKGKDGIAEFNLYPNPSKTLPSGNRGTVSLGSPSQDTNSLRRWILEGSNASDLAFFGGTLGNDQCPLQLDGLTGIRAGLESDLLEVKGQPRVIPVFQALSGNGGNSRYTVARFVGVHILDVSLRGNDKHLTVQPAVVIHRTASPGLRASPDLFRSPQLVR